jgi:hypothetical protein
MDLFRNTKFQKQGRCYHKNLYDILSPYNYPKKGSSQMVHKTPEQLAQLQLDAYNNKKLDEFVEQYHDDVVVMEFPTNKILMEGKAAFSERYKNLFANNPQLNAELKNRTIMGNHVIDHEYLTGRADGSTGEAIAIYEVNETHILKVWFIK